VDYIFFLGVDVILIDFHLILVELLIFLYIYLRSQPINQLLFLLDQWVVVDLPPSNSADGAVGKTAIDEIFRFL